MGLEVLNINKSFGAKKVLSNVSFEMKESGIFGLLGPNGAGKTTLSRIVLGILSKDSGSIKWNGKKLTRKTVNFGYLPEERGLYPKATVMEQLSYFARLKGMSYPEATRTTIDWCRKLNVEEYLNTPSEQLSKGNQQKIQLISSIIHNPELLILDEPFSGLDPINSQIIRNVLHELVSSGSYIILSAHQMYIVEEFCQNILIIDKGNTILTGNLNEIKSSYGKNGLILQTSSAIEELLPEGTEIIGKNEGFYSLKLPSLIDSNDLLQKLLSNNVHIEKFEIKYPSLEEIFIDKVGGADT
ncbi:MAG: ATP-binding cassette domain-containing protein [Firmicutes bacterium]|nr:ATP-binding cassette domain-containing protein [Bacillota bacterium]